MIKLNNCGCGGISNIEDDDTFMWVECAVCGLQTQHYLMTEIHQIVIINQWNTANGAGKAACSEWVSVDNYEDIPVGTWQAAMVGRGSRLPSTGIIEAHDTCSVIGSAFAFDMPRVYAYCKCSEIPSPPKES